MKTVGVSPKLYAAVAAAIVSYLLTQQVLELPGWAVLVLQVVSVGSAAFAAPAGVTMAGASTELPGEDGFARLETLMLMLLAGGFLTAVLTRSWWAMAFVVAAFAVLIGSVVLYVWQERHAAPEPVVLEGGRSHLRTEG